MHWQKNFKVFQTRTYSEEHRRDTMVVAPYPFSSCLHSLELIARRDTFLKVLNYGSGKLFVHRLISWIFHPLMCLLLQTPELRSKIPSYRFYPSRNPPEQIVRG